MYILSSLFVRRRSKILPWMCQWVGSISLENHVTALICIWRMIWKCVPGNVWEIEIIKNNQIVRNVTKFIRKLNRSSSFIAVAMNSRDRYEIIGLHKISHNLVEVFAWKSIRNVSKLLKQFSTSAKQSGKSNILIYSELLKFQALSKFCLLDKRTRTASQPAVRPSFTRCRPPDFSHIMYSHVKFTNFSIQWRFVHCAI